MPERDVWISCKPDEKVKHNGQEMSLAQLYALVLNVNSGTRIRVQESGKEEKKTENIQ